MLVYTVNVAKGIQYYMIVCIIHLPIFTGFGWLVLINLDMTPCTD